MTHSSRRISFLGLLIVISSGILSVIYIFASTPTTVVRRLIGTGGTVHLTGSFYTNDGNPGIIEFGRAPTDLGMYSGAALVSNTILGNTLSGYFWMGTIGWTSFQNVDFIPVGGAATDPYYLSGWAWSEYAGWIHFGENGTGDVIWDPVNTSFSGYAWNTGIGWVKMYGSSLASTSSGLIGKVKVLGNLGASDVVDTTYAIKNSAIQGTTMMGIINDVHKNVAVMLRNLPASKMNTNFSTTNPSIFNQSIIYVNTGSTSKYMTILNGVVVADSVLGKFQNITNPVYSLIVVGGDVYLDDAVVKNLAWPSGWTDHPRAIIALKNDKGVGGNIYIHGTITRIMSSLIAEGSLYSLIVDTPQKDTTLNLDDYVTSDLLYLSDRQLYINGSIISHNTIGGSYITPPICPYIEENCTESGAIRYDFNYFRDFQKDNPNVNLYRGYKNDPTYDNYSFVVEYDPRVLSDPPPGIKELQE